MANTLTCPNCKKNIELSEALLHEFQEEFELKHKKDMAEAVKLAQEQAEKDFKEKNAQDLEKFKKEFEQSQADEIEKLKKQNEEASDALKKRELEAIEEKRKIEDERKNLELTIARKTEEERAKWEERISKEKEEEYRFKEKEKEMQIDNLKRMLEEANRKASGVSQQVQGEVLEVDLEEQLRVNFPTDIIEGIAKGTKGGDILQTVRNSQGKVAGIILWETKRAKWTPSWLAKLREDTRKVNASSAILVTEDLPKEIESFGPVDGVVVTSYKYILPLAVIVRRGIMATAAAKSAAENKDENLEMVYNYLQSDAFKHRIEGYVESITSMKMDLDYEKRAMERIWKKREMQIVKAESSMSKLTGELEGLMGSSFPTIKNLSLDGGEDN